MTVEECQKFEGGKAKVFPFALGKIHLAPKLQELMVLRCFLWRYCSNDIYLRMDLCLARVLLLL